MIGTVREISEDVIMRGIIKTRLLAVLVISLLLWACHAMPSLVKPRLEEDGQVFLYLKPITQEAERLTFRLEGIYAVRGDGSKLPISIQQKEISGKNLKRERLLASGNLPPGQYMGFSFATSGATLQGEEGEIALLLAEEKLITSFPFSIARKKGLVLSLAFRYKDSLHDNIKFFPSFSVEIPDRLATGLLGLITSRGANTVAIFDKLSGKVVAVIPTGTSPAGMVLDPVQYRAFVAISGEDAVEVIDLLGADVINRGQLTIGDRPEELALTPDRKIILSANAGSNTVSVVDSATLIETKRIEVGTGPQSILIDRAGRRAYVFNKLSSTISVLDIGRMAVVATIATEAAPLRGELNRSGTRLYVLHQTSSYLNVIDPTTLTVVNRVHVGSGGTALKVDTRTDMIYLARRGSGEVSVYDPFSFLPVDSYRVTGDVSYLTIDGENNTLCMVLPGTGSMKTFGLAGKRTVYETDVSEDPYWVTLMGER